VPEPNDVIIRSFGRAEREAAHAYARAMNKVQRQLDAIAGVWVQHAAYPAESEANDAPEHR
jgi:hypothetical protein